MMTKPLPTPIKASADWRDYRCLQLDNGVTVCLVHDATSPTTAAAATVATGAASDPLPGLAHFCEHMVFLGSTKYPLENQYKQYLAQHGGSSNASTSMHQTTFKFQIQAAFAEHALDIFSHFFVSPLFTVSGTAREVQAVDSENSKNLTADGRRRLQILKAHCRRDHYYNKFSTGDAQTLESSQVELLRQRLLCFHAHHYRPERLTIVVAGPQDLDTLESWVVHRFGNMKARVLENMPKEVQDEIATAAKEAPEFTFSSIAHAQFNNPFDTTDWPKITTIEPLRAMRRLVLQFPLPPVRDLDQSPIALLSHLLGHEGPGSSFAYLQTIGLLTSLSAGLRTTGPDFTLFQVDMSLTEQGEEQWEYVTQVIFQHVALIRSQKEELARHWDENAALRALHFDQTSPNKVYALAPGLASSIVLQGTEKCLSAGRILGQPPFPAKAFDEFCEQLIPSNIMVERCSTRAWEEAPHNPSSQRLTEEWYGVDYYSTPIAPDTFKTWSNAGLHKDLKLPEPNPYIPRNLKLCPELPKEAHTPRIDAPVDPPTLLESSESSRLWHKLDNRYALPKSSLQLLVRNPAVDHVQSDGKWIPDTVQSMHASLLAGVFRQALAQETYDAELAGLHWSVSLDASGIVFSFGGFSERLSDLATKVLHEFFHGQFLKESYFDSTKDRILRNLRTYFTSRRADSHTAYFYEFLVSNNYGGVEESIKATEDVTFESLMAYQKEVLSCPSTFTECLYTGNVSAKEATKFFEGVKTTVASPETLPLPWIPENSLRQLSASSTELHFTSQNRQEENGAVTIKYQSQIPGYRGQSLSSDESIKSTACLRLISQILREPLFDELRTNQALGYIVSGYYDVNTTAPVDTGLVEQLPESVPIDYLVINVMSKKLPPPEIVERIEAFLGDFRSILANMPESELEDRVEAITIKMLEPFQKLSSESSTQFRKIRRNVPEIVRCHQLTDIPWDNAPSLATHIKKVTRNDLVAAWDRLVSPSTRARVTSCVYGSTFPIDKELRTNLKRASGPIVVNDLKSLVQLRASLPFYDSRVTVRTPAFLSVESIQRQFTRCSHPQSAAIGVAALAVVGAAAMGMLSRNKQK